MMFSLAISHTPWVPERVASMKRLQDSLSDAPDAYEVFSDKAPNHVWSEQMWRWSVAQDVEWCVFLQDDAVVAPEFFYRMRQLVNDAAGACCLDIIGLQVAHPAAYPLALEGCRGFTTTDGLVGVGYAIRRTALDEFLTWRAFYLKEGAVENITEDSLVGLWAAVTGRRIYHPIPTIVDHDTAIASTYDNADHANRHSRVRWDTKLPETCTTSTRVPHMGCFYQSTPHLARQWVKGLEDATFKALVGDNGQREARRINYARRARGVEPLAKVFIATPVRGGVNPNYAASLLRMLQDEAVNTETTLEISDVQQWSEDVVRVRSRFVSYFLNQTDCTHLLFLDSDIEMLPKTLRGMIAANKDFVACPYPRRDAVDFKRVRANPSLCAEGVAYRYPVHLIDERLEVHADGCAEVEAIALGCSLLSREGLQNITESYSELGFDDAGHGPSVALFQLVLENRGLLSEDYSFCHRWRANEGRIWMYLGDGSPVNHYGEHKYAGSIEAFGMRRGGT